MRKIGFADRRAAFDDSVKFSLRLHFALLHVLLLVQNERIKMIREAALCRRDEASYELWRA